MWEKRQGETWRERIEPESDGPGERARSRVRWPTGVQDSLGPQYRQAELFLLKSAGCLALDPSGHLEAPLHVQNQGLLSHR